MGIADATQPSPADKEITQYGLRHYDKSHGLSASTILDLCQTRDGYLWIGTYDGLNRFNGTEFTVFTRDNTPSLPSDSVTTLFQSSDGLLWVGTLGKGVMAYRDPDLKHAVNESLLADCFPNEIVEDSHGTLWLAAREGLFSRERGCGWVRHTVDAGQDSEPVHALCLDDNDMLYVATASRLFRKSVSGYEETVTGLPPGSTIDCLLWCPSTGLWVGTYHHGLLNLGDSGSRHFHQDNGLFSNAVGDMTLDNEGRIWIGGREGLVRMDGDRSSKMELKGQMVFNLTVDREGGIWAGTYLHGLMRLSESRFSSFQNINHQKEAVVGRSIHEWNNRIVVGTNLGFYEIESGYLVRSKELEAFDGVLIRAAKPASDGGLWVATHTHGAAKIPPSGAGPVEWISTPQGLGSATVRAIIECRDGTTWMGTANGLYYLRNGQVYPFEKVNASSVLTLHELRDGTLFVGMDGDGFYLIGKTGTRHYSRTDGLPSGVIFYAWEDENGELWISTSGGGLLRYDGSGFRAIKASDGMISDSIFYLMGDRDAYLWMGSNAGIIRVGLEQLRDFTEGRIPKVAPTLFDKTDGISLSGITSVTHPFSDSSGNFWFATISGVSSVAPTLPAETTRSVPCLIESVRIDAGEAVSARESHLVFAPGTRRLTFRYVGMTMNAPEKNRFRVMLEGFERDWIDVKHRREHSYTNLKPGSYEFRVMADSGQGEWPKEYASLRFTLKPHFHETRTFLLLASLGVILGVWATIILRTRQLRQSEVRLKQQVSLRTSELEKALEQANEAADEALNANESKSFLLAMVSHEVRNPINGILGIADIMLDTPLTPQQSEYLEIIRNSSESLTTLLNELLDFSRISSGKIHLERIPFSLRRIVRESIALVENRRLSKNLTLDLSIESEVPDSLIGDPTRLRQVLLNLLSNAVKFTEKGGIKLMISRLSTGHAGLHISFDIRDTGPGIPAEAIPRLFEPFVQASHSTHRSHGGSGLGLVISRDLVRLMGGEIHASNLPQGGACFRFDIQLDMDPDSSLPQPKTCNESPSIYGTTTLAHRMGDLRILLVDDDRINREIGRHLFHRLGVEIQVAEDAPSAIALLSNDRFDVLFLDHHMPGMSGSSLARELRGGSLGNINPDLHIVGMSGSVDHDTLTAFREAGIHQWVPKPYERSDILLIIERFLSSRMP